MVAMNEIQSDGIDSLHMCMNATNDMKWHYMHSECLFNAEQEQGYQSWIVLNTINSFYHHSLWL